MVMFVSRFPNKKLDFSIFSIGLRFPIIYKQISRNTARIHIFIWLSRPGPPRCCPRNTKAVEAEPAWGPQVV